MVNQIASFVIEDFFLVLINKNKKLQNKKSFRIKTFG